MTPLAEKLLEAGALADRPAGSIAKGGGGFLPPRPPDLPGGGGDDSDPWDDWGLGWDRGSFDPQALLDKFEKDFDQEAEYYNRCQDGEYMEEMTMLFLGITDKPKAAAWIINTSDRIPPDRKAAVTKRVMAALEFQLDVEKREKEVPVEAPDETGENIQIGDRVRYLRLSQQVGERDLPLLGREGVVAVINDGTHPSVGHSSPEKTCYWVEFDGLKGLRPTHRQRLRLV